MAAPDWEAIESTYRAGLLSVREITDKPTSVITEAAN
jgi:hypothetical protein